MKSFFKYMLATVTGIIVSTFLLVIILIAIISSAVSKQDKVTEIKPNSILHIRLKNEIPERSKKYPVRDFDLDKLIPQTLLSLSEIIDNIEKAKTDENIAGIYLDLSYIPAGISTIGEIRNALVDFKQSGKFIISHADYYTTQSYYLASAADKLYLTPTGMIQWFGYSAQIHHYKGTLEKLGVKLQVFKQGKYKGAPESFTESEISESNREQISRYINNVWNNTVNDISAYRGIPTDELNKLSNEMAIRNTTACIKYNFIDSAWYKDQVLNELAKLTGKRNIKKADLVSMHRYNKIPKKRNYKGLAKNKIAVVIASGTIVMGEGDETNSGASKIARELRNARKDSSIKAVVLRVNSPGGSALASEIIAREVALTKQSKPVIVSQGNVAASGGYYISALADTIVANPNTITGSIGVFGILPNAKELMNEKLGITVSTVNTNEHSDFYAIHRPLNNFEKAVFMESIDSVYSVFLKRVSHGRHLSNDEVQKLAQGRIWTGEDAFQNGLVDVLGDLRKAIDIAAWKAGITTYRVTELPTPHDPFEQIIKQLSNNVKAHITGDINYLEPAVNALKEITESDKAMARLPFDIVIK